MVEFGISEVIAAVSGELIQGRPDLVIRGLSTDSRQINPGELFIALKGERFDGHLFIEPVAQAGAAAVIVMETVAAPAGLTVIRVNDTLTALGDLARAHRRRFKVPVIAITGSNGKTTTKDLVASVLERGCRVVKTEKNFNNEIGLPLTLFRMSGTTQATVVEMGMRGLGQIRQLAEIAEPSVAVVTNVGLTHLEILQTQENIARAKGELVEALAGDGVAILNGDDPLVRAMAGKTCARTVFYGIEASGLDYQATAIQSMEAGSRLTVRTPEGLLGIELPLPGRHNIMNALAAVAVAQAVGLNNAQIQAGLAAPEMTGKRLNIVEHNGGRVIDDTYNASPTSVQAALDVLAGMQTVNRKIAVLGDMLELGPEAGRLHRELGVYAAKVGISRLLGFGELAREYVAGFNATRPGEGIYYGDKAELILELHRWVQPGDDILIKGSRGMKMEEVVAALTKKESD